MTENDEITAIIFISVGICIVTEDQMRELLRVSGCRLSELVSGNTVLLYKYEENKLLKLPGDEYRYRFGDIRKLKYAMVKTWPKKYLGQIVFSRDEIEEIIIYPWSV